MWQISRIYENTLVVTSIVILKVSSLYNIGHNKCKELFPTKLQFKVDKNPMWMKITNDVPLQIRVY
jgi:hypothetical protein